MHTHNTDTHIIDFISGKPLQNTPEESQARQVFAKLLVNQYGYPKAHIQTCPQWRIKTQPSDNKKTYPVDIAIFHSQKHTDDNIYMIVECKSNKHRQDISQLKDYLRLSQADIGV